MKTAYLNYSAILASPNAITGQNYGCVFEENPDMRENQTEEVDPLCPYLVDYSTYVSQRGKQHAHHLR